MELTVTVEDKERTVSIDFAEQPLGLSETQRVVELVGADALRSIAEGDWNEDAARAMLFVRLEAELVDVELDWHEFTADFGIPDVELEAAIPVEDV